VKQIETLIRLHKRDLDERRRRLVELEGQRDALIARSAALADALKAEARIAAQAFLAGATYGAFATRVGAEREAIAAEVATLDRAIDAAREAIAAGFRELKKYEITRDRRLDRRRKAEAARQQAWLDEVGLGGHQRRLKS